MSDEVIKLRLINEAVTGIGDRPLAALASGTDRATVAETAYESVAEAALTMGPEWRFATKTTDMAPLLIGERADGVFDYEYLLPPDNLEIKAVLRSVGAIDPAPIDAWEIEDSKLLVDHNTGILVRHIYRAGETSWHPNFRKGVVHLLIGTLQRGFWEDENAATASEQKAQVFLGIAARAAGHKRKPESRSLRRRRYGRP